MKDGVHVFLRLFEGKNKRVVVSGWVRCGRRQMKRTRNVSPTIHDGVGPLIAEHKWRSKMAPTHEPSGLVPMLISAALIGHEGPPNDIETFKLALHAVL